MLLGWGCLNRNWGTCHETARSKTPTHPTAAWVLLPAPGHGATREKPQRGEGSSWESWGSLAVGAGEGRHQLLGLALPEADIPSCFPAAATHQQQASLPMSVCSSKISCLQRFSSCLSPSLPWGDCHEEERLTPLQASRGEQCQSTPHLCTSCSVRSQLAAT